MDAGYNKTQPELQRLKREGKIRSVDGIWVTHYQDDHTDFVNDVMRAFNSPVYFTESMSEIMKNPGAFRMPCLTTLYLGAARGTGWPNPAVARMAVYVLALSGSDPVSRWISSTTRRWSDVFVCRRFLHADRNG